MEAMDPASIVGLVGCGVTFFVFGTQIIEAIHNKYHPPATRTKKAMIGLKSSIQIMEKHIELICDLRSSTKHTIPKQLDSLLADCQRAGTSLLSLLKRIKKSRKTGGRSRLGMGRRIHKVQVRRVQKKLDKCQKLAKAELDILMNKHLSLFSTSKSHNLLSGSVAQFCGLKPSRDLSKFDMLKIIDSQHKAFNISHLMKNVRA